MNSVSLSHHYATLLISIPTHMPQNSVSLNWKTIVLWSVVHLPMAMLYPPTLEVCWELSIVIYPEGKMGGEMGPQETQNCLARKDH